MLTSPGVTFRRLLLLLILLLLLLLLPLLLHLHHLLLLLPLLLLLLPIKLPLLFQTLSPGEVVCLSPGEVVTSRRPNNLGSPVSQNSARRLSKRISEAPESVRMGWASIGSPSYGETLQRSVLALLFLFSFYFTRLTNSCV